MKLKMWMINDNMWESGIKANKWTHPGSWGYFTWFSSRKPHEWKEEEVDYFDWCYSILMQSKHGYN